MISDQAQSQEDITSTLLAYIIPRMLPKILFLLYFGDKIAPSTDIPMSFR